MPAISNLSLRQSEAISRAREYEHLVRWEGGFWTYPGVENRGYAASIGHPVPMWWAEPSTVRALVTRGLLIPRDPARADFGGRVTVAK